MNAVSARQYKLLFTLVRVRKIKAMLGYKIQHQFFLYNSFLFY